MGVTRDVGVWTEMCRMRDCILKTGAYVLLPDVQRATSTVPAEVRLEESVRSALILIVGGVDL